VYVFHWSGGVHQPGPGNPPHHDRLEPCAPHNQIRFVRIEHGEKVAEARSIIERAGAHGDSHRQTPAAVPHPDGGIIIAFEECTPAPTLFLTRLGAPK
jgi:hypothetical protein